MSFLLISHDGRVTITSQARAWLCKRVLTHGFGGLRHQPYVYGHRCIPPGGGSWRNRKRSLIAWLLALQWCGLVLRNALTSRSAAGPQLGATHALHPAYGANSSMGTWWFGRYTSR